MLASMSQHLQCALGHFEAECWGDGMKINTSKSEPWFSTGKKLVSPFLFEWQEDGAWDGQANRCSVCNNVVLICCGKEGAKLKGQVLDLQPICVHTLIYGQVLWVMTEREWWHPHQRGGTNVAWTSILDASWAFPREVYRACPTWRRPQGKTQDTGLSPGLGTSWGPAISAGETRVSLLRLLPPRPDNR